MTPANLATVAVMLEISEKLADEPDKTRHHQGSKDPMYVFVRSIADQGPARAHHDHRTREQRNRLYQDDAPNQKLMAQTLVSALQGSWLAIHRKRRTPMKQVTERTKDTHEHAFAIPGLIDGDVYG